MVYKNNFVIKPIKTKKFKFNKFSLPINVTTDQALLSYDDGVMCFNFNVAQGDLRDGYGIKVLSFPVDEGDKDMVVDSQVISIWGVRWLNNTNKKPSDILLFMKSDNKIYYFDVDWADFVVSLSKTFNEVPAMTKILRDGLEAFIFTSPSDELVLLDHAQEAEYPNVPKIMDACYHFEKLFAITAQTRNALVYSVDTDVTKWTDSNIERIEFGDDRGQLLRLMTFNDNLYVFREFGITRVNPYSTNSKFSIEHLYQSSSYIYPESICVCGEEVMFLTKDGLYSFNGSSVKPVEINCLQNVEKTNLSKPCSACFDGKYFLACKMTFDEEVIGCENEDYVNNAVIIYDLKSQGIEILRGVDIKKFAVLSSANLFKICAIFRGSLSNKIGEFVKGQSFFGEPIKAKWKSAFSDFGYSCLKNIDSIKLLSKSDCNITICSDMETKRILVNGSGNVQKVITNIKGRFFSFAFESEAGSQTISNPEILMTIYENDC